jgi:hypothetical protein
MEVRASCSRLGERSPRRSQEIPRLSFSLPAPLYYSSIAALLATLIIPHLFHRPPSFCLALLNNALWKIVQNVSMMSKSQTGIGTLAQPIAGRSHATVIGGSIAGLLAARVLAVH